ACPRRPCAQTTRTCGRQTSARLPSGAKQTSRVAGTIQNLTKGRCNLAINLASKFSKYVDDAFAHESLLRGATSDKVEFTGVNEVSVYSVDKMEMNDYVKSGTSRYGVIKEIGDRVQTFRIERDRSF